MLLKLRGLEWDQSSPKCRQFLRYIIGNSNTIIGEACAEGVRKPARLLALLIHCYTVIVNGNYSSCQRQNDFIIITTALNNTVKYPKLVPLEGKNQFTCCVVGAGRKAIRYPIRHVWGQNTGPIWKIYSMTPFSTNCIKTNTARISQFLHKNETIMLRFTK